MCSHEGDSNCSKQFECRKRDRGEHPTSRMEYPATFRRQVARVCACPWPPGRKAAAPGRWRSSALWIPGLPHHCRAQANRTGPAITPKPMPVAACNRLAASTAIFSSHHDRVQAHPMSFSSVSFWASLQPRIRIMPICRVLCHACCKGGMYRVRKSMLVLLLGAVCWLPACDPGEPARSGVAQDTATDSHGRH